MFSPSNEKKSLSRVLVGGTTGHNQSKAVAVKQFSAQVSACALNNLL
jgi:hypothetical protein